MKCPKCSYDQKAKYGLKCGGCGYQFAFNPKDAATLGLTDGKFAACIQAASQNDTTYFTRNQLYATFCRRMSASPLPQIGCSLIVLVVAGVLYASEAWPFAIVVGLMGLAIFIGGIQVGRRKVKPQHFDVLLDRWLTHGRTIDRMIEEPSLHEPPPDWNEPDIYDYGVERLLIVERDILVDLFVKNGVHAEQRMLVIGESGYPDYLLPVAQRLLEEQPDLPVFLLHDATTHGVAMEDRVRASGLLPLGNHQLTDLGMFPEDFRKLKRTQRYDPGNAERALPVDAMMLPFMTAGLTAAISGGMAFGAMIEQQHQGSTIGGSFDFG